MTIERQHGRFVAFCVDNPHCQYNGMTEMSFAAQTQEALAMDLAAPAEPGESLHADDGRTQKKADPRKDLGRIETKQLERFVAHLRERGWLVKTDRSRPLGLAAICKNHNPATIHPRPPPEYDW